MTKSGIDRRFGWLDRAFWALWLLFPVYIWVSITDVLDQASQLQMLLPDQAGCVQELPVITSFSPIGQAVFWTSFGLHFAVYAGLLLLAHRVIRSCAQGRLFVAPMIHALRWTGLVVTAYPVVDLGLNNLTNALYFATGDVQAFLPDFAFDVTVFGVGLLLSTIAMAMRAAMRLHEDAELTI